MYGAPPPPPPPPEDTSAYRHDGFYLRFGIGAAYGKVVSEGSAGSIDLKATFTGWGPAYELLIGGTLGSGFVLGGGFIGQDITEPKVEIDVGGGTIQESAVAKDEALGVLVLGPFVDFFPDEKGGLHFGAEIGLGAIGLQDESGDSATGLGASLWGGYDFWVGKQWSLGPEARFLMVRTERKIGTIDATFEDSAMGFHLMFSALLH